MALEFPGVESTPLPFVATGGAAAKSYSGHHRSRYTDTRARGEYSGLHRHIAARGRSKTRVLRGTSGSRTRGGSAWGHLPMTCLCLSASGTSCNTGVLQLVPGGPSNHPNKINLDLDFQTTHPHSLTNFFLQQGLLLSHRCHDHQRNHHSSTLTKVLLQPPISHIEGIGRRQSCHRPVNPKPLHQLPDLQDSHSRQDKECHSTACLLHFNRHLRVLPPYPYTPSLSKVPGLHFQLPTLLFSSYALRPQHRPAHIHGGHHRGAQTSSHSKRILFSVHR